MTVLSVAAYLSPNPQGHATHTQLGMPRCTWVVWFDKPCPTCGMTTSFSHAGEADWIAAITNQPMGALLAFMTTIIFWASLHQTLFASRIASVATALLTPKLLTIFFLLAAAAWIYKISIWTETATLIH